MRKYEEHHYGGMKDVGIAFNHNRVWVCFEGAAMFRAQVLPSGELFVELYKPPPGVKEVKDE